jgi:hypothetical protein
LPSLAEVDTRQEQPVPTSSTPSRH